MVFAISLDFCTVKAGKIFVYERSKLQMFAGRIVIGLYGQVVPKTVGTSLYTSFPYFALLFSTILPFLLLNACIFTSVQRISGLCAQVLLLVYNYNWHSFWLLSDTHATTYIHILSHTYTYYNTLTAIAALLVVWLRGNGQDRWWNISSLQGKAISSCNTWIHDSRWRYCVGWWKGKHFHLWWSFSWRESQDKAFSCRSEVITWLH